MRTGTILAFSACAMFGAAALTPGGQVTGTARPALEQLVPPGFTLAQVTNMGPMHGFTATRPSENCSNPNAGQQIELQGGWTEYATPVAAKMAETLAAAPEAPAESVAGRYDEPLGKESYRGGSLVWRTTTVPMISMEGGPLIEVSGRWTAAAPGKLLGASVAHFCGSKEAARAVLAPVIEKLVAMK